MADRNCLSWWFPKLQAADLPVPRTEIVRSPELLDLLDGVRPDGYDAFLSELSAAAGRIGFPCFLRTGLTSGKHQWKDTCYVPSAGVLPMRIAALVEFSELVDILGLPSTVWAVREMLPTTPQMTAFSGDMPICREFRFFVRDGEISCWHPYWPKFALLEGFPRGVPDDFDGRYELLCYLPAGDEPAIRSMVDDAGLVLGGEWSVDVLETKLGWYITDVAEAARSFHWPDCPNCPEAMKAQYAGRQNDGR